MAGSGPVRRPNPLPAGGCAGSQVPAAASASRSRETPDAGSDALVIAEQGIFSAGGTVIQSDGTFDVSDYYTSREGSTSHVDHANVLYQIPEDATSYPWCFSTATASPAWAG